MEGKSPRAVAAAKARHPWSGVKVKARRTICAAPSLMKRRPSHSLCRKSVNVATSRGPPPSDVPSPSDDWIRTIAPSGNLAVLFSTMLRSRTSWPALNKNAPHSKLLLECEMWLFSTLAIPPSSLIKPPLVCAWEPTTRLLLLKVTLPPYTESGWHRQRLSPIQMAAVTGLGLGTNGFGPPAHRKTHRHQTTLRSSAQYGCHRTPPCLPSYTAHHRYRSLLNPR